jgi:hypothetical protein
MPSATGISVISDCGYISTIERREVGRLIQTLGIEGNKK